MYLTTVRSCPGISIHAPREGCDELHAGAAAVNVGISIHAPREGCDMPSMPAGTAPFEFQSTHPVRGATITTSQERHDCNYFNPRTP